MPRLQRALQSIVRRTSDLWLTIAPVLGVPIDKVRHRSQSVGPLPGLVS